MAKPVIRIENLSKCYRLRSDYGHVNFKEVVQEQVGKLWRKGTVSRARIELWALRELNIEIYEGELIGLVGTNGSGKSTLLKILSEVTKPTSGKVTLSGPVGSLLEVGTGFHPELTGRENIYLSGSILGMSHQEVKRKFDQIVDFAETGDFINVQVKRYSSGMYLRLAFSVAAHLDPDILIIDEALAVGDVDFQKKCLERMHSFAKQGATVIFVSHSLEMLSSLCNRCLHLEKGRLVDDGSPEEVIRKYLQKS